MTDVQVRGAQDTFVDADKPAKNFVGAASMWAKAGGGGAGGARLGILKVKSPIPAEATVISAMLIIFQGAATASGRTCRLKPLVEDTNFGNVHWDSKPMHTDVGESVVSHPPAPATMGWWFDVTAYYQAVALGRPNYGFKLTCDQNNGMDFYSTENPAAAFHPLLLVTYSTAPSKPTKLKPAGTAVSIAKPVLQCDYTDRSGSTQLQSVQVQIDPGGDFTGGDLWDSGEVPVNQPALDLAYTSYPGLAVGQFTWWRIRVKDADNQWSDWSDPTWFQNVAKGTVTIVSPSGTPPVVHEYTAPIEWTFSTTQTHFQVQITSPDGVELFHDSGKIRSATPGYTLPKRVLNDNSDQRVVVYVWDDVQREATQGDPSYVQAEMVFSVNFDDSIPPLDALEATQIGITPFVQLEWERSEAPNSWTVTRDDGAGEFAIDTDVTPAEAALIGTPGTYRFIDWTVKPYVPHTYRVRAEVGGHLSEEGLVDTIVTKPQGIWILDPATRDYVVLGGKDVRAESPDNAQTYTVLGSLNVVRSVMGLSGLSGSMSNMMLRTREGIDWVEYERRMYAFKEKPSQVFRLVWGDLNIPVILGDILIAPHAETRGDQPLKTVSFSFWQTSEHPFDGTF